MILQGQFDFEFGITVILEVTFIEKNSVLRENRDLGRIVILGGVILGGHHCIVILVEEFDRLTEETDF